MGIIGETTVSAMYALLGIKNPRTDEALMRQVEHRSTALSRRGFLGLMGAGVAGMVFDPLSGLWVPSPPGQATALATTPLGLLARRFAEACDRVHGQWATRWRPSVAEAALEPRVRQIGHGGVPAVDAMAYADAALDRAARGVWGGQGVRVGELAAFNGAFPLPVQAFETDPAVTVADALSPEHGLLARVVEYQLAPMWRGEGPHTVIDFEVAGYYLPDIRPGKTPPGPSREGARARRRRRRSLFTAVQGGGRVQ